MTEEELVNPQTEQDRNPEAQDNTENQQEVVENQEVEAVVEEAVEEVEPVKEEAATEASEPLIKMEEPPVAHDDFDWDAGNDLTLPYTETEIADYTSLYDGTFKVINDSEIISGKVAGVTESDVVLDIGFKSDGLVSLSEFRDMPELKVGDMVDVFVVSKEDSSGQLVLSRKNAKLVRAWESIVDSHNNDTILKGTIVSKTKGGLIVNVLGLETFLPGSQIDVKPIVDYDAYVGKTMEFKVVKINEAIKNAVVSHKALIESDLEAQRQEIIAQLEKGQVLEGTIKNITDFGVFIDLGGVDGLLYITDISWGRISHPSEVLELNQNLNVVVLDFDDNKRRISLGLKQLQPHPWEVLDETLAEGSTVKGKIVNIEDYGAFLEIMPGVEGLVHVSEVSWSNQPINSRDYFKLGDTHEAKIVTLDKEERKMSLSIKQLTSDPWQEISTKYPVESRHTGMVRNITPYGVFVEMNEGIGGMVHISDLSWTKRYNHPSEFTKVGEELEIVVLEIDLEGRKLALGHKQIEEDPWDTFLTVFPVGSVHEGTIIKKDDKGGVVSLQYGLEAFAPNKHLKKENGKSAILDETMEFEIIEFNRDDKRIIVSHSNLFRKKEDKEDSGMSSSRERRSEPKRRSSAPQKSNMEKTTLGDLEVLSQLKEQMKKSEETK